MARIATDGILLSVIVVAIISTIGLLTMNPLFTLLGAKDDVLPLVKEYMAVWYSGVIFIIMPPVSDSCMRAIGDMKRPLFVMLICAILNVILDPIFISFMGISGAAVATIIARGAGAILSLGFVSFKYKLIDFKYKSPMELLTSWKNILNIGIPGAIIRLLPQMVRTVLTKIAASVGGMSAVAGIAAGSRIESFSQVISMAVGVSLIPIIGQNFGAGKLERVNEARALIKKLAFIFVLY
jgi:Na+-driven multidrug efflux pump